MHLYTIGAHVEPNGHGTIAVKWDKLNEALAGKDDQLACKKLKAFLRIPNRYVGDAITNMLMIEAVLRDTNFSTEQFSAQYKENPSQMFKAVVSDRTKFTVIKDESRLTNPLALQQFIDEACKRYDDGRAFVRPSGTEDILRLYAEATDIIDIPKLSKEILDEIQSKYKDI